MKYKRQRGMTIVELVITIVIISLALIAVVNAFSTTAGRSADPLYQYKTVKLAQLYFDEILAKPYDESTPLGGVAPVDFSGSCPTLGENGTEARDTYDDVDDYIDIGGDVGDFLNLPGLAGAYNGYQVTINVTCEGNELGLSDDANAKRIILTITPPSWVANASTMTFTAYRGNF